jgi:hypothetical protein
MIGVFIVAILLLPTWGKLIIWLFAGYAIVYWKKSKWVEFESAGYLKLFHWDSFVKTQAALKSLHYIVLPGFLVLSCLTGAMLFSWLGILVLSIIGWLISKLFVQLLSPVYIEKT